MKYHATNIDVHLGDRVAYKHLLWGCSKGSVAYLPDKVSQIEVARFYDTTEWVVDLESGKSVFMAYGPGIDMAHKRIAFVERGHWEPRTASDRSAESPISDDADAAGSREAEESYRDMTPSRFAINPDKAEAWSGRIFLGAIYALLAYLYFSNR